MRIVIAGGSGFIGSPLAEVHAEEGHDVRVLTRGLADGEARHEPGTGRPGITRVGWKGDGTVGAWAPVLDGADAVVNLAGESIGAKRWTPQRKAQLRDSRILATRSVAGAIRAAAQPPPVLINSSGVGYYGDRGAEPLTEDSRPGEGFMAHLAQDWEAEARKAEAAGTRVVLLRTGVVLEKSGGALAEMMRPFRFFVGGRFGSGRQYVSWIHRLDVIEMIRWIIETPAVSGPVNATAPHPVTNRELTRALARALRRPAIFPAPAAALKVILGEMAGPLLLEGQRVLPARAQAHGYHFRYPEIDIAMRGIFGE
ncbi:MAG TPA: TIGR01777 family oxidoreductase [Vicinamibacterales bacterium]|nr:TIGR01777 family oxidoreductase [Vicinamibacterales bacterium]